MEQLPPCVTASNMVESIEFLESCIIDAYSGDVTVRPQARALASWLLICTEISFERCVKIFKYHRTGARQAFEKLLSCQSAFMDIEPRSLGVDLVAFKTASKMQQSLDVKHYQQTNTLECMSRKIPNIKPNHLFTDKDHTWLRWYDLTNSHRSVNLEPFFIVEYRRFVNILKIKEDLSVEAYKIIAIGKRHAMDLNGSYKFFRGANIENDIDDFYESSKTYTFKNNGDGSFICLNNTASMDNLNFQKSNDINFIVIIYHKICIFELADNVYESYVSKTNKRSDSIKTKALLTAYENKLKYSLIFLSELQYLRYNVLLFISNFIKFMYCYATNQNVFNPRSYDDFKIVTIYTSECCLFLSSTNLSNMPGETHGPLIAYTAERPKTLMSKLAKQADVYVNEGVRAMQSVNLGSDIGIRSNMIEVCAKLLPKPCNIRTNTSIYKDVFYNLSDIQ